VDQRAELITKKFHTRNVRRNNMKIKGWHHTFCIPYNILLITMGCIIFSIGLKGIARPHGFISGVISGLSLLIF
jgi:hypothetical protein